MYRCQCQFWQSGGLDLARERTVYGSDKLYALSLLIVADFSLSPVPTPCLLCSPFCLGFGPPKSFFETFWFHRLSFSASFYVSSSPLSVSLGSQNESEISIGKYGICVLGFVFFFGFLFKAGLCLIDWNTQVRSVCLKVQRGIGRLSEFEFWSENTVWVLGFLFFFLLLFHG